MSAHPDRVAASAGSQDAALVRHTNRVIAVVRDELAAHARLHELLARQEATVTAPASDAFHEATRALEHELGRAPHRVGKRTQALKDLAASLGVPVRALTLTSAVERLGDAGSLLATCRDELREAAAETRRRTLRVSALVRLHREVTRELLQVVLGAPGGEDVRSGGTLIDAEV